MLRMPSLKMGLDDPESLIVKKIAKKLQIKPHMILSYQVFRRSIDARKQPVSFSYTVDFTVKDPGKYLKKHSDLQEVEPFNYAIPQKAKPHQRPIVVGFGPAGMFAAYALALAGQDPIVIERGQAVEARLKSVQDFWQGGPLNPESNVQFGEGGAGAFSDGKLTTRIKDPRARYVLETLVQFGAPQHILLDQKPHVGTDLLVGVVSAMRQAILSLGGRFYFEEKMTGLILDENRQVIGLKTTKNTFETKHVLLAIGHSARDTYEMLYEAGIQMHQKPFAMGLRIEHPRTMIDHSQYGNMANHPKLGAADYSVKAKVKDRSVYSFCMCPGGHVVNASSEHDHLVVNGMSYHARDAVNSNSAILVSLGPSDYPSDHPLAGMTLQRSLEHLAYSQGGNFSAPVQLVGDFLRGKKSQALGEITPSVTPKYTFTDFNTWLPPVLLEAIKEALPQMGRQIKGFDRDDALLTGVETRSSSPVRLVRQADLQSVNTKGLWLLGEGAGYAGGITSSAVDGLLAAESFLTNN